MAIELNIYGKHIEPKEARSQSVNFLEFVDISNLATKESVNTVSNNLNSNFLSLSGGSITGGLNILGDLSASGDLIYANKRKNLIFSQLVKANEIYNVDTTVGSITATLPDTAILGDEIEFIDVTGKFNQSPFFIKSNISKFEGLTGNLIKFDIPYQNFKLNYLNPSLTGWKITPITNNIQSTITLESPTTAISSVNNILVLSQTTYDNLTVKVPTTLYIIV